MVFIWPKLASMIHTCALSGAEAGQQDEEYDDYGRVDLEKRVNSDDWSNFSSTPNDLNLINWWHKLDEEEFVKFTLNVLEKFKRVNSLPCITIKCEIESWETNFFRWIFHCESMCPIMTRLIPKIISICVTSMYCIVTFIVEIHEYRVPQMCQQ